VPGALRQLQTKAVCDATENVEAVVSFASAEGDVRGGWAVSRTRHVGSNDAAFRDYIAALQDSDGSFQETAPKRLRRILYNTAVAVVVRW